MSPVTLDPCVLLVKTDEVFAVQATLALKEAGYHTVVISDPKLGLRKFNE